MKYLLAILILVFPVQTLAAEKAYCFGDRKCYGEDYKIKYICFLDDTCLGQNGELVKKGTWEPVTYTNPTTGLVATKDEQNNIDPPPYNYDPVIFPNPDNVTECPSTMNTNRLVGVTRYDVGVWQVIKFKDQTMCKILK